MLRALNIFFVILGIIFFTLILSGTYFFVADPLNLKQVFLGAPKGTETKNLSPSDTFESTAPEDKNSLLSEKQEKALESFGIDPASLPSEITPEQESCLEDAVGEQRADEIRAGDSPTLTEVIKAGGCL